MRVGGFVLAALLAGCARGGGGEEAAKAAAPAELWETSWLLEDIGGTAVIDGTRATLEFPERGKTAGQASCNRFFGTVEVSGSTIAFGPLGATRMACAEGIMNQETRYLGALQDAERYAIDGNVLLLYSKGNERPLRFTRVQS